MKNFVNFKYLLLIFILSFIPFMLIKQIKTDITVVDNKSGSESCRKNVLFTPFYEREGNGLQVLGRDSFKFQGQAWLSSTVCQAGTIRVEATGEAAKGVDPRIVFTDGVKTLLERDIKDKIAFDVPILNPGTIYVGFVNDVYEAEVRKAILYNFQVIGKRCKDFKQLNAELAGGNWYPQQGFFALAYEPSPRIRPCSQGSLHFLLYGTKAGGEWPIFTILQSGKPIFQAIATDKSRTVELPISSSEITLKINNPYGKIIADRNLILNKITFQALSKTSR